MLTIFSISVALFLGQSRPSDIAAVRKPPDILVNAFRYRASFKTAVFACRYERDWPGFMPWVRNLELRWANGSLHQMDFGDDDGFMSPRNSKTGEHRIGIYGCCTPEEHLLDPTQDLLWGHRLCSPMIGRSVASKVWPDYVDFRTYGLRGGEVPIDSPDEYVKKYLFDGTDASYSMESMGKALVRVRRANEKLDNGAHLETVWVIDTEKGPGIILTSEFIVHPEGKRELLEESECRLVQIDGRWWPEEVIGRMWGGGSTRVQFVRAEFDHPEHPTRIDADYMGFPIGAEVTVQDSQERFHYVGGGDVVDHATWEASKSNYNLDALRTYQARARTHSTGEFPAWWSESSDFYGLECVADRPDLWEAYVRRWVIKHTNNGAWRVAEPLTDQQKSAAKGILDDCRKRAEPVRMRLDQERANAKTELAAVEKLLASPVTTAPTKSGATSNVSASRPSSSSQPAKDKSDRAEMAEKASALRAKFIALEKAPEIERLFDELKQRLNGVLTSKQADPASGRYERSNPPHLRPNGPTSRPAASAGR